MRQIWDFLGSVFLIHFGSRSQNEKKTDLKKSQFGPIWDQSDPIWMANLPSQITSGWQIVNTADMTAQATLNLVIIWQLKNRNWINWFLVVLSSFTWLFENIWFLKENHYDVNDPHAYIIMERSLIVARLKTFNQLFRKH